MLTEAYEFPLDTLEEKSLNRPEGSHGRLVADESVPETVPPEPGNLLVRASTIQEKIYNCIREHIIKRSVPKRQQPRDPSRFWSCTYGCGSSFDEPDELIRHEKTHRPQEFWVCLYCRGDLQVDSPKWHTTHRKDHMKAHISNTHGVTTHDRLCKAVDGSKVEGYASSFEKQCELCGHGLRGCKERCSHLKRHAREGELQGLSFLPNMWPTGVRPTCQCSRCSEVRTDDASTGSNILNAIGTHPNQNPPGADSYLYSSPHALRNEPDLDEALESDIEPGGSEEVRLVHPAEDWGWMLNSEVV